MQCPNCGSQMSEKMVFCPYCGVRPENSFRSATNPAYMSRNAAPMACHCTNCGRAVDANTMVCPGCGAYVNSQTAQMPQNVYGTAPLTIQNQMPMKWYKWLLVVLIIGAVLNIVTGLGMLMNPAYNLSGLTEIEYDLTPDLREAVDFLEILNMINGVFALVMGGFSIYVQRQLAGYKKNAPKLVVAMYVISGAVSMIICGFSAMRLEDILGYGIDSLGSNGIVTFAVSMAFASLNNTYFKKRAHLFVN